MGNYMSNNHIKGSHLDPGKAGKTATQGPPENFPKPAEAAGRLAGPTAEGSRKAEEGE